MTSLLLRRAVTPNSSPLRVLAATFSNTPARQYPENADKSFKLIDKERIFKAHEIAERHEDKTITITEPSKIGVISGIPEEHIKERMVRIYEPIKNCMQSGTNNIGYWELEFDNRQRWENPLMGWCSTGDPLSNMKLEFSTCDEAVSYCEKYGYKYFVDSATQKPPKAKSYALNFHWSKRTRTSTK